MKKVLLRGPALSKSGYGVHCRQVYKYLSNQKNIDLKVEILPWGITPWYLNREDLGGMVGEIIDKSYQNSGEKFDVSFQVQLPNEWDPTLANKNVGITAAIETTVANPMWTTVHCEKMDLVVVPSEHAKKSLVNAGKTNTPIEFVPESYFDEIVETHESIDLGLTTKFNFLTVGVLTGMTPETDRKNLLYLIKWFVENFRDNEEVGLVIKTNQGRDTTIDRKNTEQLLCNVLRELGHNGTPKVYMLHGPMNRKEMSSLYKHPEIKAFVSCTRGEGFGLPFLEASAAGLPVIATNWSAHKEFLDLGKWISLKYSLGEVHDSRIDGSIFIEGTQWANVTEDDFKKKITTFYEKPDLPRAWAKDLAEKVKEEYSFEAVSTKYNNAIGEILK